MKKRILALALAGTTAFSVFGAAMSANAASSHVVFGNDPYVSYKAATVKFSDTNNYYNKVTGEYITAKEYAKLPEKAYVVTTTGLDNVNGNPDHTAWDKAQADVGYTWINESNPTIYKHVNDGVVSYSVVKAAKSEYDVVTELTFAQYQAEVHAENAYTKAENVYSEDYGKVYTFAEISDDVVAKLVADGYSTQEDCVPNENGMVTVDATYGLNQVGAGELVTAELSRDGITVENGNVYAYDYYTSGRSVVDFENAWDDANIIWNKDFNAYTSTASSDVKPLQQVIENISSTEKNILNKKDIVTGKGGYNDNRGAVIDEFEEFMYDLGLFVYDGYNLVYNIYASKTEFLSAYSYKYNGADQYNFVGLVNDLFDAANGQTPYTELSSSNLVYLMQQYDKYVDGSYIGEEEINDSKWADLLISCLEAVDAEDFRSGYAGYAYNASKAISAYNAATTPAKQEAAIAELYKAVVSSSGRSAGVDKAELAATLNSLYFNNKNIPTTYVKEAAESTNAELALYGYAAQQNVIGATVVPGKTYKKAVYPLYPVADYTYNTWDTAYYNLYGKEYAGIAAGSVPDHVTAEYEWFANVYQLATKVNAMNNNGSYQGIVDTVNAALEDAVADLAPLYTPAGSTTLRLEEAVEKYAGKIDTDYAEKYFNAYEKANAIAETVEGDMATKYAIEMVIVSGTTLGYQSAQTTITKGDIKDLNAAIKEANTALKAIKESKDYNAAQVYALNKAIDNAEYIVAVYNGEKDSEVNKTATKTAGDKDAILRSDVTGAIDAINAAIDYSKVLPGWSKNADGAWQYGTADGYLNNTSGTNKDGWVKIRSGEIVDDKAPGQWYKFTEDGTIYTSYWLKENGKDYYLKADGAAAIGWAKIDNQWYYFGGDCAMKTGWVKSGGNWYYLSTADSTKGEMVTGWAEIGGKWYYFSKEENAVGQMLYNTTTPDGYTVDANGVWVK